MQAAFAARARGEEHAFGPGRRAQLPKDFYAAYRAVWPKEDDYAVRRDFYNLYHVLNHANLFAGHYVRQGEQAIERLLAELG